MQISPTSALAGSFDGCGDLLRQITINASTTLALDLECSRMIVEDVCRFPKVFPFTSAAPIPNEALHLTSEDYRFKINAWPLAAQQGSRVKDFKNAKLNLHFYWARGHATHCPGIIRNFLTFTSPQLRSFHMSGDPVGWDVDLWKDLANVAQNLQRLIVDEAAPAVKLCETLQPPDGPNTVSTNCCLPVLSYLELRARHNHAVSAPDGSDIQLSAVLADCLAARAAVGCPTPELVFIVSPWEELSESWSEPFTEAVPGIIMRKSHGLGEGVMPAQCAIP